MASGRGVCFLLLLLALAFGGPPIAVISGARPKNINVALQTKWQGTSFLLEAGELLAKLRDDYFWSFIQRWPAHSAATSSDEACFNKILYTSSSILNGPIFHLSLLLRSASPKLVLFRQLAKKSLLYLRDPVQVQEASQCESEEDDILCGTASHSKHQTQPCCWVDVGQHIFSVESELIDWLDLLKTVSKEQEKTVFSPHPSVQLFEFDHAFPHSVASQPVAILYAALDTSCFGKLHPILAEAAKEGLVNYVLRPYLSLGCVAEQGACAFMGSSSKVLRGGYGIDLALKNMEYKAIDDSDLRKSDALDEARTDDLSEEVRGFIFSRILEQKPDLSDDLLTFRDHLLSSSVSDTMNVWELKDLGYQTAQRILRASEPLRVMQDINQNFSNLVSSISRLKLNETIKEEIVANQRLVIPGKNMIAINGALLDLEGLDLYSLIELVLGELSLADIIAKLKVPSKYVTISQATL